MKFIAFLVLVQGTSGLDIEFKGFKHFYHWDGHRGPPNDIGSTGVSEHKPFSKATFDTNVMKDICASDVQCDFFGGSGGDYFFQYNHTTEYDIFLGIKGQVGTAPAAFCTVQPGGGNYPSTQWLACPVDELGSGNIINTFPLPPDLIHSTCLKTPQCAGFRLKNDGSSGDIFGAVTACAGYWKLNYTSDQKAMEGAQ
jgi:hypothetical protein